MGNGFVKIYGDKLVSSSLWDEAPEVRLVWLAMLAIADARGYVDIPNERALARVLNVAPDYLERGLAVLMAPDKGSRTKTLAGRRVVREGAGWLCVNYEKYREFRTEKQELDRKRQVRHREKKKPTEEESLSALARMRGPLETERDAGQLHVDEAISAEMETRERQAK